MSKPHSPTPPTPSSAAASDERALPSLQKMPDLNEVAELVSSFGFFGVIWLNRDLIVTSTYGRLVEFVARGVPLSQSVLPLIGPSVAVSVTGFSAGLP